MNLLLIFGRIEFLMQLGSFAIALMLSAAVMAMPQGGRITQGSGYIEQSGSHTDIHQNSDFLATQWSSFNIAKHESAQAHQPRAASRLLIRIDGAGPTNISGSYTSNGITIIENQNGVQFSRGAVVNVGGLLATSARIKGITRSKWMLDGTGGAVVNHGTITAGAGGAVLAAVRVENTGTITSTGGDVALGAGEAFTVDFAGGLVGFEVKTGAVGAALVNEGRVEAQGGIVKLTAQEAQAVRANVVSVGGVVKATKLERRGGVVYLSGGGEGINEVSAQVEADEKVETTGRYVAVKSAARIKASEILVGGDYKGGNAAVQNAQRTLVEPNALLDAGEKGRVIVWSDETTWFHGKIKAPNGFAEVSGKVNLAAVNLAGIDVGVDGALLLDPRRILIVEQGPSSPPPGTATWSGPNQLTNLPIDSLLPGPQTLYINASLISAWTGGTLRLEATERLIVDFAITNTHNIDLTLRVTAGNIEVNQPINVGIGLLRMTANRLITGENITLTASEIYLKQGNRTFSEVLFNFDSSVQKLSLTTTRNQTVRPWMVVENRSLNLVATGSSITVEQDMSVGKDKDIRLEGQNIFFSNSIELRGKNIRLIGAVSQVIDDDAPRGLILLLAAHRTIVLGGNILWEDNEIIMKTGISEAGNIGVPENGDRLTLTAKKATFEQRGKFSPTGLPLELAVDELHLSANTKIAHEVYGWMIAPGRGLSFTSGGAITLNRDINTGPGDLALSGTEINIVGVAGGLRELSGAAISLTATRFDGNHITTGIVSSGAFVPADVDLCVTASGVLTISGSITTGAGDLILGNGAMNVIGGRAFSGHRVTLPAASTGEQPLTINATDSVNFSGSDEITLEAPALTITATHIDFGGRNFKAIISSGTFTLSADIKGARGINVGRSDGAGDATLAFIGGAREIIGQSGVSVAISAAEITTSDNHDLTIATLGDARPINLSLYADINIGRGVLTLSAGARDSLSLLTIGAILTASNDSKPSTNDIPILTAATIKLIQQSKFSSTEVFVFRDAGALELTVSANNQNVADWMLGFNRDLTLTNQTRLYGSITIDSAIVADGEPNAARKVGDADLIFNSGLGKIAVNANIKTRGVLTLKTGVSSIELGTGVTLLQGASVDIAAADQITANGNNIHLTISATNSDLTIKNDINVGAAGRLTLMAARGDNHAAITNGTIARNGTTTRILTAATVKLLQQAAFENPDTPAFSFTAAALELTTEKNQIFHDWMGVSGMNLTLITCASCEIISHQNIDVGSGAIILKAGSIDFGSNSARTLSGATLNFKTNAIYNPNGLIRVTAAHGAITTTNFTEEGNSAPTVTTRSLTLEQTGTFADDLFILPNQAFLLTLKANGSAAQSVKAWMLNGSTADGAAVLNRSFSFTATDTTITIGRDINITRNLTLKGMTIAFSGGARVLSGNMVSLTSNATTHDGQNITIKAGRDLSLDMASFDIGAGVLRLTAGEGEQAAQIGAITFANSFSAALLALTASSITLTQDETFFSMTQPERVSFGAIVPEGFFTGDDRHIPKITALPSWLTLPGLTRTLGAGWALEIGLSDLEGGALSDGAGRIESSIGIVLNAGAHGITFNDDIADDAVITLTAQAILITAASFDLGGRVLKLIAAGGVITLDGGVDGLRIFGTANPIGAHGLELQAMAIEAGSGAGAPRLNVPSVSITQSGAFASTTPFKFSHPDGIGTVAKLTLKTAVAGQRVHPSWMLAANRDLTLTNTSGKVFVADAAVINDESFGALTLTSAINKIEIGANITIGGALTLNSRTAIDFLGSSGMTLALQGATIILNGTHVASSDGVNLTLTAMTGDVSFESRVAAIKINGDDGTDGEFVVVARQGSIFGNGTIPTLTSQALVSLTQGSLFAGGIFDLTGVGQLTLTTTAASGTQPVSDWMLNEEDRGLSLTADSAKIAIKRNIITGANRGLILSADQIQIAGSETEARILSGRSVQITAPHGVATGQFGRNNVFVAALVGNFDLSLMASGVSNGVSLDLNADVDLGRRGSATLTLEGQTLTPRAGSVITAAVVSITQQDALFAEGALYDLSAVGTLKLITHAGLSTVQNVQNWMLTPQARNLSLTSDGVVRIGDDIAITGDFMLKARGVDHASRNLMIEAGDISIDSATLIDLDDHSLVVRASGALTLAANINASAITLTTGAGAIAVIGARDLTALTIRLAQVNLFGSAAPFAGFNGTTTLELTTSAAAGSQEVYDWMAVNDRALSLSSARPVVIDDDIELGRGALILSAARINIGGAIGRARILSGAAVSLTARAGIFIGTITRDNLLGEISAFDKAVGDDFDLTISAQGDLIVAGDVDIGAGALRLSAGDAISRGSAVRVLRAASVILTHDVAFADELFNLPASVGALTLTVNGTVNGETTQGVHQWMLNDQAARGSPVADRAFVLTADSAVIEIKSDIKTGARDFTLSAAAIQIIGAANGSARILSGNVVSLIAVGGINTGTFNKITGDFDTTGGNFNLEIIARGNLTLGGNVNVHDGALSLVAGRADFRGEIDFGMGRVITAISVLLEKGGAVFPAVSSELAAFQNSAAAALEEDDIIVVYTGLNGEQTDEDWFVLRLAENFMLQTQNDKDLVVPGTGFIERSGKIIFNAGAGDISFAATSGAVILRANVIEITAGSFNLGGDRLTIVVTGSGGALTIAADITEASVVDVGVATLAFTGADRVISGMGDLDIVLTAGNITTDDGHSLTILSGGDLTLNSDINIGGGALTLTADSDQDEADGALIFGAATPTLTAEKVHLTQDVAFGGDLFSLAFVSLLELDTDEAQTVLAWMVKDGRGLDLASEGVITIRSDIELGSGDLTLAGLRIRVEGAANNRRLLTGNEVNLSGDIAIGVISSDATFTAVKDGEGNFSLTITADGVLTLGGTIDVGGGDLILTGMDGISLSLASTARFSGGHITITGAISKSNTVNTSLFILAQHDLTLNDSIDALPSPPASESFLRWQIVLAAGISDSTVGNIITPAIDGSGGALPELKTSHIVMTQDDSFGTERIFSLASSVNLLSLTTRTDQVQPVHDWMDPATGFEALILNARASARIELGRDLSASGIRYFILRAPMIALTKDVKAKAGYIYLMGNITGDNDLTVIVGNDDPHIVSRVIFGGDVDLGAGALSVSSDEIFFADSSNDGVRVFPERDSFTLSAREISLTGTVEVGMIASTLNAQSGLVLYADYERFPSSIERFTLEADENLTIDSASFDVRGSVLVLKAGQGRRHGGVISFTQGLATNITASFYQLFQDGALFPVEAENRPANFLINEQGDQAAVTDIVIIYEGGEKQKSVEWAIIVPDILERGDGSAEIMLTRADFPNGILSAIESIMLNAGARAITFSSEIPEDAVLTIKSGVVTLIASAIDFGARSLTIVASAGQLTLNGGGLTGMTIIGTGALTLTADTVGASAGPIILADGSTIFDVAGDVVPIINVPRLDIAQNEEFAARVPMTLMDVASLTLSTSVDQAVHDWMIADGRTLALTSRGGVVKVETRINNRAAGGLTLTSATSEVQIGSDITIGGALALNGSRRITFSGARALSADHIAFSGAVYANNTDLTLIASRDVTLTGSFNIGIYIGTGKLTLTADSGLIIADSTARKLTAGTVSLTHNAAFADDLFTLSFVGALVLTTQETQIVHDWMVQSGMSLSLMSAAEIVIRRDIDIGAGDLILSAAQINIEGEAQRARSLSGGNIGLTARGAEGIRIGRFDDGSGFTPGDFALTIDAAGALTLDNDLSTGAAALSLSAASGDISSRATPTLIAETLSLTQGTEFRPDFPFIIEAANNLTITLAPRVERQLIDHRYGWLFAEGRGLTIAMSGASAQLRIVRDIDLGANSLVFEAGYRIVFFGVRTISADSITLNSAVESDVDLTFKAASTLTVHDITLSGVNAVLTLDVEEGAIGNGGAVRALAAGALTLAQADLFASEQRFTFAAKALELKIEARNPRINIADPQVIWPWMVMAHHDFTLDSVGAILISGNHITGARDINLKGTEIRFEGDPNNPRILSGNNISLHATAADEIRISALPRIDGSNVAGDFDLTIIASGALTLMNDISVGSGALILAGETINVDRTAFALTAGSIKLAQDRAFTSIAPFNLTLSGARPSLEIETGADQTIHSWMIDGITVHNQTLSVTSTGQITISNNIDTGTGALTLRGSRLSITGGGALSGRTITLNGAITSEVALIVRATGTPANALTLESGVVSIAAGDLNALSLSAAMGGISLRAPRLILSGYKVALTGAIATPQGISTNLTIIAQHNVRINNEVNIRRGALVIAAGRAEGSGDGQTGEILWPVNVRENMQTNQESVVRQRLTRDLSTTPAMTMIAALVRLTQDGALFSDERPVAFQNEAGDVIRPRIVFDGTRIQAVMSSWYDIVLNAAYSRIPRRSFVVPTANIRRSQSITLNAGARGTIKFRGFGPIVLAAPQITITARRMDIGRRALTIMADRGTLTLNANIIGTSGDIFLSADEIAFVGNVNRSVTGGNVRVAAANVTSAHNVALIAYHDLTIGADFALADNLTLTAGQDRRVRRQTIKTQGALIFLGTRMISAKEITLTADAAPDKEQASSADLILTAHDDIHVRAAIHVGGGALTLIASGNITSINTPTLTAASINMTQNGSFDATVFDLADIVSSLTLETQAAQTVHAWMIAAANNRSLSLASTHEIIVAGDVETGTGDLSLSGSALTFNAAATLSGMNISLTGAATADNTALTFEAMGILTLNHDVAAGTGALTLTGAQEISLGGSRQTLSGNAITLTGAVSTTASTNLTMRALRNLTIEAINLDNGALVLTAGDGSTIGDITFRGTPTIAARSVRLEQDSQFDEAAPPANVIFAIGGNNGKPEIDDGITTIAAPMAWFTVGQPTNFLRGEDNRDAQGNLLVQLEAGNAIRRFRSITLDAGAGAIAFSGIGAIILEARTVKIIAGDIDLGTRVLTITASGGTLTLNTDLTSTANITLSAEKIVFAGGARTISGAAVSLTSMSAITGAGDVIMIAAGTLKIAADFALRYELSLEAGAAAATGALMFSGARSLSGSAIRLTADTAPISPSNSDLTLIATGNINVAAAINLGSGALTLTASRIVATGAPLVTAARVALTQNQVFGGGTTGSLTLMTNSLSLFSRAVHDQAIHNWMIASGRDLAVRSGRDIRITAAMNNFGAGDFTAEAARGIVFTNATIIEAGDITLTTGANNSISTGDRALTLTAQGDITINADMAIGAGDLSLTVAGAINFAKMRPIKLSGNNIRLVANMMPEASDQNVSIRARANLTLGGSFDAGAGNLSLEAGTSDTHGGLNFSPGAVMLSGNVITLTGNQVPSPSSQDLTVIARDDININTDLDIGMGNLTLEAGAGASIGALQFQTNAATKLQGNNITLIADAMPRVGQRSVTIEAQGNLTVSSSLNTGRGDLTLKAGLAAGAGEGSLFLAPRASIQLLGGDILLEGDGDSTAVGTMPHDLTIRARGNLDIYTDVNLLRGTRQPDENISSNEDETSELLLEAGLGSETGLVRIFGDRALTANRIILRQDGEVFGARAPADLTADELVLSSMSTADQAYHSWMGVSDRSLSLESKGGIVLSENIDLGTGALTLRASRRTIRFSSLMFDRNIRLAGGDITLAAARTITTNDRNLEIVAAGDLRIDANINTNTGTLNLEGRTIMFGGNVRTRFVDGGAIMLTAMNAPTDVIHRAVAIRAKNDLRVRGHLNTGVGDLALIAGYKGVGSLIFDGETMLNGNHITLTGDDAVDTDGKVLMPMASDSAVRVIARRGLNINVNINVGTGALTLEAGAGTGNRDVGALQFRTNVATFLSAAAIKLSADASPRASHRALTISAIGALVIGAAIDAGVGDVALMAGGAIEFSATRNVSVSGNDILLAADAAPQASNRTLRITARGDAVIGADINTGAGDLVLTVGNGARRVRGRRVSNTGAINFVGARRLSGDDITLTADTAPDQNAADLMIVARGSVNINTNIDIAPGNNLGGNLTLVARVIQFSTRHAVALKGNHIVLNANASPRASHHNLMITSLGTLTASSNLNVGRGALTLNTISGAIEGSGSVFAAGVIRLIQEDVFGATSPFSGITLRGTQVEFIVTSSADQTFQTWMLDLASHRQLRRRRHLTVRVGGNLLLSTNIDLRGQNLVLEAGYDDGIGAINFMAEDDDPSITLRASNIALLSTGAAALSASRVNNFDIAISATSGNLVVGADINVGTGDLTLSAVATRRRTTGRIVLTRTSRLNGNNITLTAARNPSAASDQNLTIEALGNVDINTNIIAGAGDVSVVAGGALNFKTNAAVTLSGHDIALVSGELPRGSGQALTVIAAGALEVSAAINLVRRAGRRILRGELRLTAGRGAIVSSGAALTARVIRLTQAAAFAHENPFGDHVVLSRLIEFAATSASAVQRVYPWMVMLTENENVYAHLTIRSAGDIIVDRDIELASSSNLTLEAGQGKSTGAIHFTNEVSLSANNITLTADGTPTTHNVAVALSAWADLLINADIDAGAGNLSLTAGTGTSTGEIRFSTARMVTLSGDAITLNADRTPRVRGYGLALRSASVWAASPFIGARLSRINQIEFITMANEAQKVHDWMISLAARSQANLAVRSAGDIVIAGDVVFERDLIFEAGLGDGSTGVIDFTAASIVSGRSVTLEADGTLKHGNDVNVTIRAARHLNVGADANAGTGDLTFEAGFSTRRARGRRQENIGALTLKGDRNLSGNMITLMGDLAPLQSAGSITITAEGSINVNSDINAGAGDLRLTANGGAINFNTQRMTALTGGTMSLTAAMKPTASGQPLVLRSSEVWATTPFAGANPDVREIEFIATSSVDQPVYDWIVGLAAHLSAHLAVRAAGDVMVVGAIDLGERNLTLEAGYGEAPDAVGVIRFMGGAAITLSGHDITLSADPGFDDGGSAIKTPPLFNQDVKIEAQRHLMLNANLSMTGALSLMAGAGMAVETGEMRLSPSRRVILTARQFTLTADRASQNVRGRALTLISSDQYAEDDPFGDFRTNVREIELITTSQMDQTLQSWMAALAVRSNAHLVIRAARDLNIRGDLILVTTRRGARSSRRDLTLEAGRGLSAADTGTINFDTAATLDANTITLRADGSAPRGSGDVVIRSSFNVDVGADLNAGAGDLRLEAGFGRRRSGRRMRANTGVLILAGERILSGMNIMLAADRTPSQNQSASSLKAIAMRDIHVNMSLLVTGALSLTAGMGDSTTGALRFSSGRAITLSGHDIKLTTDATLPNSAHRRTGNVIVRATGDLSLNGQLTAGRGNLVLAAGFGAQNIGVINVGASVATILKGNHVTLSADATDNNGRAMRPMTGSQAVTIEARRHLTLDVDIMTVNDLALMAGTAARNGELRFSRSREIILSGKEVTLASDRAPSRGSDRSLTVEAADDLNVDTDINLGSGALVLTAGRNTQANNVGVLNFRRDRRDRPSQTLAAASVTLSQDEEVFDSAPPVRFARRVESLTVNYDGNDAQAVQDWMVLRSGIDLKITSDGSLDVERDIEVGAGALALSAARGMAFAGEGDERRLAAASIALTSGSSTTMISSSAHDLTIDARGDVRINNDIALDGIGRVLEIRAGADGSGKVETPAHDGKTAPSLTASHVSLEQADEFSATRPFDLSKDVSITTRRSQRVQDWMVTEGQKLSLTTRSGDITFGTGEHDLGPRGELVLSPARATKFEGTAALRAGRITVNSDIDAGASALTVEATEALNFDAETVKVSGRALTLTAGSTRAHNLFIEARASLTLGTGTSLAASRVLAIDNGKRGVGTVKIFNLKRNSLRAPRFDVDFPCQNTQCLTQTD